MSHLSFSLRRVQKEIENFKNKKHIYKFNILEFFENLKFEILSQNNKNYLMIYDKYLNLFTQLEINQCYPFKPYNVRYLKFNNSLPYLNNLNNLTELFKNRDKTVYIFFFRCMYSINPKFLNLDKNECYCCKSLTCTNEWCPSFTFTNLLLEQIEIKFMKCYSSNLGYRYIKNIYDTLFIKLHSDIVLHILTNLNNF
jgi:hypothetical protein